VSIDLTYLFFAFCKMAMTYVVEELCKSWEKSGKMELLVLFLEYLLVSDNLIM